MAKLVRKTFREYTGRVYDLCVAETHSYNVEGKAVHNSAGGSLLSYLLNITQLDPVKHGLLFERFLVKSKNCLAKSTFVLTPSGPKQIKDLRVGDIVFTNNHHQHLVKTKSLETHSRHLEILLENGTRFGCSHNHKWMVWNHKSSVFDMVLAEDLMPGMEFFGFENEVTRIKHIFFHEEPKELVDIGIEHNHTFFVSDKSSGPFYLTHNSYPDVDCGKFDTLVVKSDTSHITLDDLKPGDRVFDLDGNPQTVLVKKTRFSSRKDRLVRLFLLCDNTYGSVVVTDKHRLISYYDQSQIFVKDIEPGTLLLGKDKSVVAVVKTQLLPRVTRTKIVDISVTGNSTFQVIPFNVAKIETSSNTFLVSADDYTIDTDVYMECLNGKTKRNCGIVQL